MADTETLKNDVANADTVHGAVKTLIRGIARLLREGADDVEDMIDDLAHAVTANTAAAAPNSGANDDPVAAAAARASAAQPDPVDPAPTEAPATTYASDGDIMPAESMAEPEAIPEPDAASMTVTEPVPEADAPVAEPETAEPTGEGVSPVAPTLAPADDATASNVTMSEPVAMDEADHVVVEPGESVTVDGVEHEETAH